ncbi:MAG: UvrB/UvrC motif-containing protein [Acutalibacteraceae bacterium]
MTEAAENMEFEKAARIRDRIAAIKKSVKSKSRACKGCGTRCVCSGSKRRQSRNSRSVF